MPHQTLRLVGGVDQNRTPALNEAGISESNLIRMIPDAKGQTLVQKLGGWQKFYSSSIGSIVRALWAWEDTNGNTMLGVGAESSLDVISSNTLLTITPQTTEANITVSFSTTIGSSIVTVDATGSGLDSFDSVYLKTQVSIGGLVLFGVYPVIPVTANQFQISAVDALRNPAYATASVAAGGSVAKFSATSGSASLTITLANHGYSVGSTFPVLVPTYVGNMTLSGNYIVTVVNSANDFVITAPNVATTVATKSTAGTGATATVTFNGTQVIPVGSTIVIAGVTPAGYNGTFTVTASSAGSVSFASATTGVMTVAGTLFVKDVYENGGKAKFIYYNGIGPSASNLGYGVGGYGVGGYGAGIVAPSGGGTSITATDWTLDNWGETFISCPLNGPIFKWSASAGDSIASIIPQAPPVNSGAIVAMPQRQIIAWGSTLNGVQDKLLIRWCDVNNYNVWAAQTTNQAGSYRIPKGSRIIQCIQGPQQTLVWTDLAVWAMQYAGPPYVYQFNEIGSGCGLIGRKAATAMNGAIYWMGQSQFFRLSGSGVEPIACPIWDVIFQDLDKNNLDKIRVAPNSRFGEISWFYPTTSNGEVNKYVKYNVLLNQWDFGTLARTAWINESVLGAPIGASPNQYIYQHETSENDDGSAMYSWFQTGYFVMSDADMMMFVDEVWPDMKWGYYGGSQNANVQMTFFVCDFPGQTPEQFGPYSMTEATTFISPRLRGRLVSIKIESNDTNSFWRIGAMRYRVQQDGRY